MTITPLLDIIPIYLSSALCSSSTHPAYHSPHMSSSKSSTSAPIKQARKALASKIRNDFEYTFPSHLHDTADIHQTLNIATSINASSPLSLGAVTEWRERDDSDPSTEEDQQELVRQRTRTDAELDALYETQSHEQQKAHTDEAKKRGRKRRRKERLDEEMEWNTGLRFWEARRDAWCAARKIPAGYNPNQYSQSSSPLSQPHPSQQIPLRDQNRLITVLPIAPPLLPPNDPTRASITPAMYPSIYAKVVNQGLMPAVPINLSDVIPALVQGWQADGEWPPKPSVPEPSMAKMKNSLREHGQAYSRYPTRANYGTPAKEGDSVKKRGVSGLFGAMTGIMGGNSSSTNLNTKKEQQSPTRSGVTSAGADQGMRRIISRHLRNKSSMSTTSDSHRTERNGTGNGNGNVSDNDTPGGNGLIEEGGSSPGGSPAGKRKSTSKMGRVLRSLASGTMPAHEAG